MNSNEDQNNPGTFPICTGFIYINAPTTFGVPQSACGYYSQNPLMFGYPTSGYTGLIKIQYYQAPPVTTTAITTSTTTTTSSSSASYTPSQALWPCPDYDGEYRAWPDNQNRGYTFACSAIAYPANAYTQQPAPNNWNDCITQCNSLASSGCTGFWYAGGVNGQGAGTCYFINFNNGGFLVTNNTNVAGRLGTYFDTYRATTTITSTTVTTSTTSTTTTSTTSTSPTSSVQTVTFTTVSYATVTTLSSYPVTTTAVSTQVQTLTTTYPVTQTQVSTAPGKYLVATICSQSGIQQFDL